jgi:hypothetical protein
MDLDLQAIEPLLLAHQKAKLISIETLGDKVFVIRVRHYGYFKIRIAHGP